MDTKIRGGFWSDPEIEELGAEEKLAVLWLMTNPRINVFGFSETSPKRFTFETSLPSEALERACRALPRAFVTVEKGVWVRNYIRHNIGDGKRLASNNIARSVMNALERTESETLRALVLQEYPALLGLISQALPKPLPRSPQGQREREGVREGVREDSERAQTQAHPASSSPAETSEPGISGFARLSLDQARLCKIVGRTRSMLSYEAHQAMAVISPIPEEEFALVEWFYALPADPDVKELGWRRSDADKLACFWQADVDRARAYSKLTGSGPGFGAGKKIGAAKNWPAGARPWLGSLRAPEDTEFRLPPRWSDLPGDLRGDWNALTPEARDEWAAKEEETL